MTERRWIRAEVDNSVVESLCDGCDVDAAMARLLVTRGINTPDRVERFLSPRLSHLPDPSLMKDLDRAAARVVEAIDKGEQVALYGDYDADGVTSTTLLTAFLAESGLKTRHYIPKRLTEGYGLNAGAVETLNGEGVTLLITLDCGITATKEIGHANDYGIDTIVVDHHLCPDKLPDAFATLNPHQDDCEYPDKGLAAVGVCFNLVIGIRKLLRDRGDYQGRSQPNLRRYLDLVALGTIADMVPLCGANRVLASFGVEELRAARRPGIRALMEVSRIRAARCSSGDVGFRLGPRINAAGRLSDASVGVQLLLAEDMGVARPLAATLDAANGQRQKIQAQVIAEVVEQVEAAGALPEALVLYDESWHPGVVGVAATRIIELYERPTIIIGEGGRGSGRTARGLHLLEALNDCSTFFTNHGGHAAAAGLKLKPGKFAAFREAFVERVKNDPNPGDGVPTLEFDDDLDPKFFTPDFVTSVDRLQPFGLGNPQPLFRTTGVSVKDSRVVGREHLKLRLNEGGNGGIQAIAFKRGEMHKDMSEGSKLDVAYHIERSEFSGMEYLQLNIRDLCVSEPPAG